MCVGTCPRIPFGQGDRRCLPHMRGDVPCSEYFALGKTADVPHAWGCSSSEQATTGGLPACLAHAGMFLIRFCHGPLCSCLPHMRGDLLALRRSTLNQNWAAPYAWGCSAHRRAACQDRPVCPAHAGMFLTRMDAVILASCPPRTRGDVPSPSLVPQSARTFSPHTRGCSHDERVHILAHCVCPTRVGMHLSQTYPRFN